MLISDIISEIISEVGGDTADTSLVTKMLGFYKAGIRRLPAFIRDRNFYTVGTYTLPAASNTMALSNFSGFIREREVWFQDPSTGIHIPIYVPLSISFFNRVVVPTFEGKPRYYVIHGRTMQFDRLVEQGLIIGMDYLKEISSIALTDSFTFDEQILEASKHFCKMIYFSDYEEDAVKARENERRGKEIAQILEEEFEVEEMGNTVEEKI